jgi:hypothetical protein
VGRGRAPALRPGSLSQILDQTDPSRSRKVHVFRGAAFLQFSQTSLTTLKFEVIVSECFQRRIGLSCA